MRIVLYVGGLPFNGDTIKKKSLGGSETAGYYLAKEMVKLGHEVFVFTGIEDSEAGDFEGVRYIPFGERSEQYPLGITFMNYALHVPHDILIAQRIPAFFSFQFASKVNIWWTHDLAIKRAQGGAVGHLWNVDRILAVSDFHKEQIKKVYGIDERILDILPNAVEIEPNDIDIETKLASKTMIYSSRPERGLENLVKEGGIMEQLQEYDPEIKLIVCGYDNVTEQMAGMYNYLWRRCDLLQNVQNVGALTKEELYAYMKGCWIHIYPTAFEETSCITAMEAQSCGNPFVTTRRGALEETLKDGGVIFSDLENIVDEIKQLHKNPNKWRKLHKKALAKAEGYKWSKSASELQRIIDETIEEKTENKATVARHLIYNSDIVAAYRYAKEQGLDTIEEEIKKKFGRLLDDQDFEGFYADIANYNTNEIGNDHGLGDDKFQLNMPRIQGILKMLSKLPAGSKVLDYGCCVGQVTAAYARAFPKLSFTAYDISPEQMEIGKKYASENNISNLLFTSVLDKGAFDAVVCSEVLEHQIDYKAFLEMLESYAKEGAKIAITVPSGAMESVRWDKQQVREHLHHFEPSDIQEILGHKADFICSYIPLGENTRFGDSLGNFSISWIKDGKEIGEIDYERKIRESVPTYETLSVCMIVKPDGFSLGKCLSTIKDIADEIIIGVDGESGRAYQVAEEFGAKAFQIDSPVKVGFDTARNQTIEKATSDWIMWIDDDETFQWPERIKKYLRHSQYDAFAIHQHHFSAEPAGVIKTDLPCRIFRNGQGIRFYGHVHEHPEKEINRGAGNVFLLPQTEVAICHNGYDTEDTRRKRFERNFPLMVEDRRRYPERHLGKFLWIRDLAHMNRFEHMKTGAVSEEMYKRAGEAIAYWRELIKDNQTRMVNDAMQYVGECVDLLTNGQGILFEFGAGASKMGVGDHMNGSGIPTVRGKFINEEDIQAYTSIMLKEKLNQISGEYL